MYILDTDHLSLIQRGSTSGQKILTRLSNSQTPFATTIVDIVEFTPAAAEAYRQLRKALPRLGAMDLKIGAITLTQTAIVLTRNQRDFQQIPGLQIEDWS